MICNIVGHQVPLLMRSIYLANKNKIGKVDDVFGPMSAAGIAVQLDDGVKADSFKAGDKVKLAPTAPPLSSLKCLLIICYIRSMLTHTR
jgi:H/ACA ribonucleoprotein complex subunit 1